LPSRKMLSLLSHSAVAYAPGCTSGAAPRCHVSMSAYEDLEKLAVAQNPILGSMGVWDPLGLTTYTDWEGGESATIGFLRQAELKHGRVAMAAFVGYCVQSNGVVFPGPFFADVAAAGSPPEQWDALPTDTKLAVLGTVGLLEVMGENSKMLDKSGGHYMKGGTPGACPYPLGFTGKLKAERKETLLNVEVNNGRAAMFGIMGFLAAAKVPGSVPALGFIKPYAGEVMAPFTAADASLPFVTQMLGWSSEFAFK